MMSNCLNCMLSFLVLFWICLSCFLDSSVCCSPENVIDSDITSDRFFEEKSEWCVTKSIVVEKNVVVTIEKGVTIMISPKCSIVSYGTIKANGEGSDYVTFTSVQIAEDLSTNWGFISINGCQDEMTNVIFEYGGYSNGISGTRSDWDFQDRVGGMVRVTGCSSGYYNTMKFSGVTFSKSRFLGLYTKYGVYGGFHYGVEIEDCNFLWNGYGGMYGHSESIKTSHFENNGWRCNSYPDSGESWCSHALSIYSYCSTSYCDGIQVQHNTFNNNKGALAVLKSSYLKITVQSNHFEGNFVEENSCGYDGDNNSKRGKLCSVLNIVSLKYSSSIYYSTFKTNSFVNNSSPEYVVDFWSSTSSDDFSSHRVYSFNDAGMRFAKDVSFSSNTMTDNVLSGENRTLVLFESGCSKFTDNEIYRNAGCSTCSVVRIKSLSIENPTSWELDSNYFANPMFQYELETADLYPSYFTSSSSSSNPILTKYYDLDNNWWGYTTIDSVSERVNDFRQDGKLFLSNYENFIHTSTIATPDCSANNYCFFPRSKCVENQDLGGMITCECDDGYYPPGECTKWDCSTLDNCGGETRGVCIAPNQCECKLPYYGPHCSETDLKCPGNPVECSGHGVCEITSTTTSSSSSLQGGESAVCVCIDGFEDDVCSTTTCYGIKSSNHEFVCNSHGRCVLEDMCQCDYPYFGQQCETRQHSIDYTCFGIPMNSTSACTSNGICIALDLCQCNLEYTGDKCEKKKNTHNQSNENEDSTIVATVIIILLVVMIFFCFMVSFFCCCCFLIILLLGGSMVFFRGGRANMAKFGFSRMLKDESTMRLKENEDMTIDTEFPSINSGKKGTFPLDYNFGVVNQ